MNLVSVNAAPATTNIPLSGNFPAATGISSQGTFQYDDVGTLTFGRQTSPEPSSAAVIDPDFTAVDQITGGIHGTSQDCNPGMTNTQTNGRYGCVIGGGNTMQAGRFRPDHYEVAATLTAACNEKFTYMGQAALGLTLGLQAMSANGVQLTRYDATSGYTPLATFSITGVDSATIFDPLNNRLTPNLLPFQWTNGGYAISGTNYSFNRLAAPDGSYENFTLKTTITDSDGVLITSLNGAPVSASTVLSNPTAFRFGRLKLSNVSGSEQLDLPVQASTQYWKSNVGFVTNTDDSCTQINAASVKLQNTQGGLNASNMPANNFVASPLSFNGGLASVIIHKPLTTPSTKGSVDLCVDLAADNTPGTICSATTANMPWLQGRWNGAGTLYDDDPSARATFGIFKSGPVIYTRELY
jgi:MSHA biogenesis protein MshQ